MYFSFIYIYFCISFFADVIQIAVVRMSFSVTVLSKPGSTDFQKKI